MRPGEGTAGRSPERFLIRGEEGISEYWRRDKSPVEVLELAKLLRGIRKIVSRVGRNCGTVVWEGMPAQADGIPLDPSPVLGSYPVPAAQADIAVGIALRGALLKTEWTEHVKKLAATRIELPPVYAHKFNLYLEIAEKVYADLAANRTVFGLYAQKGREWESDRASRDFINPPSFSELLHNWWRVATDPKQEAFRRPYEDLSVVQMVGRTTAGQFYTKPMALLNSIVEPLITVCPSLPTVTERCEYRFSLYCSIFNELLEMVKFWPADRKDPFLISNAYDEDTAQEEADQESVKSTLLSYADEIESTLAEKQVDYTDKVRSLVANFGDVARVEGNDIVMPAKNRVDQLLLNKLVLVLQTAAQRDVTYNRGLDSGRIDRRRLFRAPTTGAIFNLKKTHHELPNDLVLLVDCTGSMADPNKWNKTELVYQTLFTALLRYNPRARLLAYNERSDTCRITEIYRQGRFFSVIPNGRTASGEAIIATALSLGPTRRRPFIIHVTDGASNYGCGVADAIRYCKKEKINLLTVGLECDPMNETALRGEYGEIIQFLRKTEELPALLKQLLVTCRHR